MSELRLRAPTNARAFSFNSYFFSAEYPEYVCTTFNDQYIALVDTPSGTPYADREPGRQEPDDLPGPRHGTKWPIGINIAAGHQPVRRV